MPPLIHRPLVAPARPCHTNRPGGRLHRGLSLVELLVGIAVGMLVVAGASMLAATQLGENRRMLAETQVQQDLRATSEIISRELRRAGLVAAPMSFVWTTELPGVDAGIVDDMTPTAAPDSQVGFRYVRGPQGPLGFQLDATGTGIQTRIVAAGGWQDLTDRNAMIVTQFLVTPRHAVEPSQTASAPQRMPCPKLCADLTTNCWPTVRVREYMVQITGRAKNDAAVVRNLATRVRVRNDELVTVGGAVCPA